MRRESPAASAVPPSPLELVCDKFINDSDTLVTVVRMHNPTRQVQTIYVDPIVEVETTLEFWEIRSASGLISLPDSEISGREPRSLAIDGRQELPGNQIVSRFRYAVVDDPPRALKVAGSGQGRAVPFGGFAKPLLDHKSQLYKVFGHHIQPGRTKVFKAALELRTLAEPSSIDRGPEAVDGPQTRHQARRPGHPRRPVAAQVEGIPILVRRQCPLLRLLRSVGPQDVLPPGLRPAQEHARPEAGPDAMADAERRAMAEHLVSQRHQLRGGPPGPRGALAARPEVLAGAPAHLGRERESRRRLSRATSPPKGPSDGQYTDWITSTAWDGQLVHPDKAFLAQVVEKLAANVRGWQRDYDPDGDGLLAVDSHWWTGMEYQPSFFYFSDYKTVEGLLPAGPAGEPRAGGSDGLQLRQRRRRGADLPLAGPAREGPGVRRPRRQDRRGRDGQDVAAGEAVLLLAAGRR